MKFRVGVPRNHPLALPVLVDDWIPADHLARVVDRVVDALDLSEVEAKFHDHGPGAPAYSPKLLLKLLAYGYLTHRFSSRRISLACREDLGFLWLARPEQPRHSVISDFRQQHVDDLPEWLAQVVLLCIEEGMVGWKLGALDGTKIHADASKHKAMSFGRMTAVIPQLEEELKKIVAAHGAADDALPADPTVAAVPADHEDRVRERLAAIRKAQADLKAQWAKDHPADPEPPDSAQINFTDPESHIMVTKNQGVQQAYNSQIVVDAQEGIIVAAVVSAHPNDMEELAPAMEAVQATGGQMFEQTVADAGYFSAANVQKLEALGSEGYIAAGSDTWRTVNGQKLFGKGQFRYDPTTDVFRCPGDQKIEHTGDGQESVGGGETRAIAIYRSDRATCGACSLKAQCLTAKQSTKKLTRGADDAIRDAMKAKVRSPEGDAIYRRRKAIVEPAIGIVKETMGFRQWSLRGLRKVRGEFALVAMAYDIRKIWRKMRTRGQKAVAAFSA